MNCLMIKTPFKSDTKRIYAGCGDGQIYNFDLDSGRLIVNKNLTWNEYLKYLYHVDLKE